MHLGWVAWHVKDAFHMLVPGLDLQSCVCAAVLVQGLSSLPGALVALLPHL